MRIFICSAVVMCGCAFDTDSVGGWDGNTAESGGSQSVDGLLGSAGGSGGGEGGQAGSLIIEPAVFPPSGSQGDGDGDGDGAVGDGDGDSDGAVGDGDGDGDTPPCIARDPVFCDDDTAASCHAAVLCCEQAGTNYIPCYEHLDAMEPEECPELLDTFACPHPGNFGAACERNGDCLLDSGAAGSCVDGFCE